MHDALIVALQERVRSGRDLIESRFAPPREPRAPVSREALAAAESTLGVRLPGLMRRLYLEVANGGFGPGYGLLGLAGGVTSTDGHTLEREYSLKCQVDPEDLHWDWPSGLLPAFELGCAMFLCVDGRTPEEKIVVFEPNPHEDGASWADAFIPSPHPLAAWLESWLDGPEMARLVWRDTFPDFDED